eukprot:CAMPEP_0182517722 /NCGR_PEP_ID=MMETSP1321-20130603/42803_1 /TAXON_ID=91990 /ORGANISM="Bolidomonas sp., Strain RCC1657" /LENGTH=477 /DNA_ID=CAMNT_0024725487 /DNA_START=120 /DNA_END=1549 /DNA_ORIENTATION=+
MLGTAAKSSIPRKDGPWLHAWHDPVASIKAKSECVRLVDLNGDSSNILLVADERDKKMRVYKGTSVVSEHQLLDQPVSMCVFYTSDSSSSTPAIGIAGGPYVFIYRHLRPYFKFTLPFVDLDPQDESIWAEMDSGNVDAEAGWQMLQQARDSGAVMSSWSLDLLSMEDEMARAQYVAGKRGVEHKQHTVVTCMETLRKDTDAEDAVSSLVIGTENNQVLILDPSGAKVICHASLPSTPSILAVTGLYDIEWRIVVACRDGKLYTIKSGEMKGQAVVQGTVIELETQPNALARIEKSIYVTTMDAQLSCYHIKGRKLFSVALPAPATCTGVAKISRSRVVEALIVSLANGEVRLYNGKHLIHVMQFDDVVVAMRWGQMGREQNSCAFIGRSGSLTLKMMSRQANLEKSGADSGPPAEQDVPLRVPKKTKLYVEQSEREVDNAIHMHRVFQRDLCKLRLTTARSYVKIITSGEAGVSTG